MMPYEELLEQVLESLDRARALESIRIVRDLYATEVDEAARGVNALILHPDHRTGRIPADVLGEVHRRLGELQEVWA